MRFDLDLEMRFGSQYNLTKIRAPRLYLTSADDYRVLGEHFVQRYGEIYSPEATFLAGGINIESFCVSAWIEPAPFTLAAAALADPAPPASASIGQRPACWHPANGFVDTPVYDLARLLPGNVVLGAAILEARETTYVVEPGWSFRMDAWRNGVLEVRKV
jgi:N-methylhydantoinase A/acetophenone carboxylase